MSAVDDMAPRFAELAFHAECEERNGHADALALSLRERAWCYFLADEALCDIADRSAGAAAELATWAALSARAAGIAHARRHADIRGVAYPR